MYPVSYHKPASVDDAVKALSSGEEAMVLAGGQTLIATMKQHLAAPSDLVDIRGIAELSGIKVSGDTLSIGAATTHAEVAASKEVQKHSPALACLAAGIGDPAVRHMGTLGGSVANNDPAADYPAALLSLGATVVTNKREIAAEDFFTGLFSTDLEEGEIITRVDFGKAEAAGYAKFAQPASLYALVGVFVAKRGDDVRVAVTGAGDDGVFHSEALEAALAKDFSEAAAKGADVPADGLMSDIHGDADYRAHLIRVMAARAVTGAA